MLDHLGEEVVQEIPDQEIRMLLAIKARRWLHLLDILQDETVRAGEKTLQCTEGPDELPKSLLQFTRVFNGGVACRCFERRWSDQPFHRFFAELGGQKREVGRRRLGLRLIVEGGNVGRSAEGQKLPQFEIVGLELRPVDARQMDLVQIGAVEGLSREDAAVHRQEDGSFIGDTGRIAQPYHLDR